MVWGGGEKGLAGRARGVVRSPSSRARRERPAHPGPRAPSHPAPPSTLVSPIRSHLAHARRPEEAGDRALGAAHRVEKLLVPPGDAVRPVPRRHPGRPLGSIRLQVGQAALPQGRQVGVPQVVQRVQPRVDGGLHAAGGRQHGGLHAGRGGGRRHGGGEAVGLATQGRERGWESGGRTSDGALRGGRQAGGPDPGAAWAEACGQLPSGRGQAWASGASGGVSARLERPLWHSHSSAPCSAAAPGRPAPRAGHACGDCTPRLARCRRRRPNPPARAPLDGAMATRVLCVAEKNSVAEGVARVLAGPGVRGEDTG